MESKRVEDMSVEELKALAYDTMKDMQRLQNNLAVIEGELNRRANETR